MTESSSPPEIRVTRTFNAPREKVYEAWTEPERYRQWWGTPDSMEVKMDVRPGGRWSAPIEYEGDEMPFHGYYFEVEKYERLVFSLSNDPDFEAKQAADASQESLSVEFTAVGDKTEMTFIQKSYLPEDQVEEVKAGWNGWFDALEEYLAKA
ncbi:SRPBCC domain-containing protein [Streptosporangium oxazolinicum]|uniref:SRPBCC domain-containing protein n=1 Tax=Streptosporangium oxazolinicum TaxID=909287 RepID=A0ABP8B3P3_9ACTN